jgi:1-acyl-sn-glycerol-3-phosphate acyltransferase
MVPVRVILYTVYSYVAIAILTIIYAIPILLVMCIPKNVRFLRSCVYWVVYSFYIMVQKISLLRIVYRGACHMSSGPFIFVANHQSSFDIPLLGLLARGMPHIWLTRKDVLQNFWFIGFLVSRFSVLVDVTTPRQGMRALLNIIRLVKQQQCHVMIFPEGSRFANGTINEFYNGFAVLARRLGIPVVPVYINGMQEIYPPYSTWAQWGTVTVTVGSPMSPKKDEPDDVFKRRVHRWFLEQVP